MNVGPRQRKALTIEFDGGDFRGWQWQPTEARTVQAELQRAWSALPGEHGRVHAAGRTDAGVHALAMVAHVDTTSALSDDKLRLALNARLPGDVAVLDVRSVPDDFEAQYSCRYRRYLYRMRVARGRPTGMALDRDRVLMVHTPLDVSAMAAAAGRFEGHRDFSSLATQETRTRERTILMCEMREELGELRLHVAADGFLRGMVRAIAGTLLKVGLDGRPPNAIDELLDARDRRYAGKALAPHALYFVEAGYEPWDAPRSDARLAERIGLPR